MYSKLKLSELKNTNFKTKHHFLYKIVKVLEVANFTFLANFRFLTLPHLTLYGSVWAQILIWKFGSCLCMLISLWCGILPD